MKRFVVVSWLVGLAGCSNDSPARELCPVEPAAEVPHRTLDGLTLRWGRIECIDIFLEPTLGGQREALEGALDAFEGFACSELCFAQVPEPPERVGILFVPDMTLASTGQSDVEFNSRTGVLQRAVVRVNTSHPDFRGPLFGHWLGLSLGLDRADADSIMSVPRIVSGTVTAPTAADEDAFCGLYRRDC